MLLDKVSGNLMEMQSDAHERFSLFPNENDREIFQQITCERASFFTIVIEVEFVVCKN